MIQQTSLEAFYKLEINKMEKIVLATLLSIGGSATNQEIADHLLWQINRVTPRMNSLVKKGRVEEFGLQINPLTGKNNIVWRAV